MTVSREVVSTASNIAKTGVVGALSVLMMLLQYQTVLANPYHLIVASTVFGRGRCRRQIRHRHCCGGLCCTVGVVSWLVARGRPMLRNGLGLLRCWQDKTAPLLFDWHQDLHQLHALHHGFDFYRRTHS